MIQKTCQTTTSFRAFSLDLLPGYIVVLGPENHGSHFERGKTAFWTGASKGDVSSIPAKMEEVHRVERSSMGSGGNEKGGVHHV